jgi:hypothetical protein
MPVAVVDGEHPEPAEEMEIGDVSLPIDDDTGGDGQVGFEDTNGAMGRRDMAKIVVAHGRHCTGKRPMYRVVGRRPGP